MADTLSPLYVSKLTTKRFLISIVVNGGINTLIAGILTGIGFGTGFFSNFVYSQCIGMSILLLSFALLPLFARIKRLPLQIVAIAATVIAGAFAGTLAGTAANGIHPVRFLQEYSDRFGQVIILALLFGFVISYIFISLDVISGEKLKRLAAEKNTVEAELKLLQSQMEPHFLFNTLANCLGLIETDPPRAKRMLESFTAFLRASFLTARERTVPLSREMDVVRNYLDIYSVRMGRRLRFSIDIPAELREVAIPPLLIQPLVENAIRHGLEPAPEGGMIEIGAVRAGDMVRITVVDSGVGMSEKSTGAGIGLENAAKRLHLLYGARGSLILVENEPSGVKAVVEVPYETD